MNRSIIQHYIKRAYRELIHFKLNTAINVLGLTLGLTACFLIVVYIRYEKGFDKFNNKQPENVYRLTGTLKADNGELQNWAMTPSAFSLALKENLPEVENSTRILRSSEHTLNFEDNNFRTRYIIFADSTLFDILAFPLELGDPKSALLGENGIVLTHKTAKKLFGKENPMGKLVSVFDKYGDVNCIVTGVLGKEAYQSHLDFEAILSYPCAIKLRGQNINHSFSYTRVYNYLRLKQGIYAKEVVAKFPDFLQVHCPEVATYLSLDLQPLESIHLSSNLLFDTNNGTKRMVYWLGIVGLAVLFMACVNYVNITVSSHLDRMKPVAVSRILGARNSYQFLNQSLQSVFVFTVSAILAVMLSVLMLPYVYDVLEINIPIQPALIRFIVLLAISVAVIGSILIGLLSSLLSRFSLTNPGKIEVKRRLALIRPLVVVQFAVTIILISGTLVIFKQFSYINNKDLGFDIENKLVLIAPLQYASTAKNYRQGIETFINEAEKVPGVEFVSSSYVIPGQEVPWTTLRRGSGQDLVEVAANMNLVDYEFLNGYKYRLMAGNFFSKEEKSKNQGCIINKVAMDLLGFNSPEEAIGQKIQDNKETKLIVGVIENSHQQSLKTAYIPFVIHFEEFEKWNYTIGLTDKISKSSLNQLENLWCQHFPEDPYDAEFLGHFYRQQYKKDYLFSKVFAVFCLLSILISIMGIYSLSVALTIKKTKEIGIRKVSGAKTIEILELLNIGFLKWVLIAFLIGSPFAFYVMNKWLENFAYKTGLSWWIFVFSGLLATIIALLTVSWQSWRAATKNPVEALRYE